MNLVEVPITDGGVKFGNSVVPVSREALTAAADRGDTTVTVGVRPEHFDVVEHNGAAATSLTRDAEDAPAGLAVSVNVVEELGANGYVYGSAQVGGGHQDLVVRVGGRSVPGRALSCTSCRVRARSTCSRPRRVSVSATDAAPTRRNGPAVPAGPFRVWRAEVADQCCTSGISASRVNT